MNANAKLAATGPLAPLAAIVLVATAPVWLPLTALSDAIRRRRFATVRAAAIITWLVLNETAGLFGAAALGLTRPLRSADAYTAANYRLQRRWVGRLFAGLRVIYGLDVSIEGALPTGRPVLLLPRHTGMADTLLPFVLFDGPPVRHPRYVLKKELLWGPCLNAVGRRLPNAFVARGSDDKATEVRRVAALADGLGERDVVVIFPEGTRFSEGKRARLIARLEERGEFDRADAARQLRTVMPFRVDGVEALLEEAGPMDVVFMAHTGLEGVSASPALLEVALHGNTVRAALLTVPADQVPTDPDTRRAWLHANWRTVDDTVHRLRRG